MFTILTENEDYEATNVVVTFEPGERNKNVNIPILDDTALEDMEMFVVTLTSTAPNVIIDTNSSTADVFITDNSDGTYVCMYKERNTVERVIFEGCIFHEFQKCCNSRN